MKIRIKVKTNQTIDSMLLDNTLLVVRLKPRPVDGLANKSLINLLSNNLKIPKADIKIVRGANVAYKTIELADTHLLAYQKLLQALMIAHE